MFVEEKGLVMLLHITQADESTWYVHEGPTLLHS